MRKKLFKTGLVVAVAAACAFGVLGALGCSSPSDQSSEGGTSSETPTTAAAGGEISVYSREDGSGTRGAFVELFGLEEEDASGNKIDMTTDTAVVTNSTSVMMTSVASDPNGIGYISLGSLNDTVKALSIDGVEATAENVKSGDYKVSRPFNIVTTDALSPQAQDFIDFIMSADGQAVVEENGYIAVEDGAAPYAASDASGKVVVAGSSSVTPVMEKLAEAYQAVNSDVSIEVQQSDSTTGVNMAVEGTCDIGMASRELKDSETAAGAKSSAIAKDGIAVIVAPDAATSELTSEQVKDIFSGTVTNWSEIG
ncbi:phosphate ABC transporter substrate-binding protein [Eggerthellaceae bacterium zg-887]|uniref:substrate-binding domain-containing protein n=1 Tax=Xiamenia xianingshaonis TaxID=2682776 RepID=UPI0013EC85B9|nr:substrate-binding domain-containing protein [Xiamenia xianingshaonis]NGM16536.1 phosphate ABC transporter substrate-binding protein [Eggerthellaceae bacterium zg-893]NHM15221.1 phosphate ABC transporter substrate-binding protein [Xiamenia xianingshaonis]